MTIHIDPSKTKGLEAKVAQINAAASEAANESCDLPKPEPVLTTPQEYLTARIDDLLLGYDREIIEAKKRQFDDIITIAASFDDERQAILIAKVQELAAEAAAATAQ